jgi:putative N6-adenine-specific DNA methylase
VAFTGRLTTCYLANLMCRTASRVLMRIHRFKVRDFETLEKRIQSIAWELYLRENAPLRVRVSTHASRLYHSGAVAERIRRAVTDRLTAHPPTNNTAESNNATSAERIWARLENDQLTLSLDSSGNHLHKRGVKTRGGPAPLRETLAAAALMLAGYDADTVLCDPMCGSGTFAIEAAMMIRQIPPGWYRSFAFMDWPAFRASHWSYLRQQAASAFTSPPRPLIYASDRSRTAVEGLSALLGESDLGNTIDLRRQNFFDMTSPPLGTRQGLIALNPPYGRRLGRKEATPRLMGEILHKLQRDFRGWQVVLVLPEKRLLRQFPFGVTAHRTLHGGHPVWLAIGRVPL